MSNPIQRELINGALAAVQQLVDMLHQEELFGPHFQEVQLRELRTYSYKTNDFVVIPGAVEVLNRREVFINNTFIKPTLREGILLFVLARHAHHWLRRRQFAPSLVCHLTVDDVRNLTSLAGKLCSHRDELSKFLWPRLSEQTRQLILSYFQNSNLANQLRSSLIRDLNQLTQTLTLRTPTLLRGVNRSGETRYAERQEPSDAQRAWLNRSILADAYSGMLRRVPSSFVSGEGIISAITAFNQETGRRVWQGPTQEDIFRAVSSLRVSLKEANLNQYLIETGHGYRISTSPWNIAIEGESVRQASGA